MTSTAPEPATPETPPKSLRDMLFDSLDPKVENTPEVVEAVCDDMVQWLRTQADEWHQKAREDFDVMGYGKAAALMCQGFADGIEAGRPQFLVTNQDLGVQ